MIEIVEEKGAAAEVSSRRWRARGLSFGAALLTIACGLVPAAAASPGVFFEVNGGQLDPQVLLSARGPGYGAHLLADGIVLDAHGPAAPIAFKWGRAETVQPRGSLPGRSHYLLADRHVTGLVHFREVLYRRIRPGVDVRLHGSPGALRYDFELAAGVSPEGVRMAVEGASKVELAPDGSLVVSSAAGGRYRQAPPIAFQQVAGERRVVPSSYVLEYLEGAVEVGFRVASFDPSLPLVIDPTVLVFASFLGGTGVDVPVRVKFDADGDLYLVGTTDSPDFPVVGAAQPATGGGRDAFVSKLASDGGTVLWSTYLGGSGDEFGIDVAIDQAENVYVVGQTDSPDLPVTLGAFDGACGSDGACDGGQPDAFFAKLAAAGDRFVYLSFLGDDRWDRANGVAVAPNESLYVTGFTESPAFPVPAGAFQPALAGRQDAFLIHLDDTGRNLVAGTFLGGSDDEAASTVALSPSGEITLAGATFSDDFPLAGSPAPFQSVRRGIASDAWVARLEANASALVYSTYLGGTELEFVLDVDLDAAGNAWVGGYTQSDDFPVQAAGGQAVPFQPRLGGGRDGFFAALEPSGAALQVASYFGGVLTDEILSLTLLPEGGLAVAGSTASPDLAVRDAFQDRLIRGRDGFVALLRQEATELAFGTYFGGEGDDFINGVEQLPAGDFVFAGSTDEGLAFPIARPFQPTFGGGVDGFVARLRYQPPAVEIPTLSRWGLLVLALLCAVAARRWL
ncbi:MAG: IPTL-CTERM sorting domain-containing protein [Acidobacteriota bacterium]